MTRYLLLVLASASLAHAQAQASRLAPVLDQSLVAPEVVSYQLQQYLMPKAPKLPVIHSSKEWAAKSSGVRKEILQRIVFHGWPREWVDAPPRFEEAGLIQGKGYRIRKLRYEIVPGMWSAALLYEPENIAGQAPAVLNVNGHVGPAGKTVEYKQKRCIEQALMGMYALNLEWFSFGELNQPQNVHWFAAHLDLAGANGVGLFYLAMRKGLDYLAVHPNVDSSRLAVTGLSGGGWQTILLSSLDERVKVSIPVAGYSALPARLERPGDIGDIEQNPTDMLLGLDYSHLTAMRAPNPTLLIYNAEDDCCFRAPLVKEEVYDRVKYYFQLFGAPENLAWHENRDPADHNYQLDNRMQAYRFLARHFGLKSPDSESPQAAADLRPYDDLTVGLPSDNLSIVGLARKLGEESVRNPSTREQLLSVIRYPQERVAHAWASASTKSKGVETRSFRFEFPDGLSATGVWIREIGLPDNAPATILLNDEGRRRSAEAAAERVNRGEQVLVADLLFSGDVVSKFGGATGFPQLLSTTGDRPLGLRAGHLNALARWLKTRQVRLEVMGMRSQLTALAAAAAEPGLYREIAVSKGIATLRYLLDKPVEYQQAPEMFCLDLYKRFDIGSLEKLATVPVDNRKD